MPFVPLRDFFFGVAMRSRAALAVLAVILVCALPQPLAAQTFYYDELAQAQKQAQAGDVTGAAARAQRLLEAYYKEGQTDTWMLADIYYVAAYLVAATGQVQEALKLIDRAFAEQGMTKNLALMYELQGSLYMKLTAFGAASGSYKAALALMDAGGGQTFSPQRVASLQLDASYAAVRSNFFRSGLESELEQARSAIAVLHDAGQGGLAQDIYIPRMQDIGGDLFAARDGYAKLLSQASAAEAAILLRNMAVIDWQVGDYATAYTWATASEKGLRATGYKGIEVILMQTIALMAKTLDEGGPFPQQQLSQILDQVSGQDWSDLSKIVWFLHWTDVLTTVMSERPEVDPAWVHQLDMAVFDFENFTQDALATRIVTRIRLNAALAFERLGDRSRAFGLFESVRMLPQTSDAQKAEAIAGVARTGDYHQSVKQSLAVSGAQHARFVIEQVPSRLGKAARQQQDRLRDLFELSFETNYRRFQNDPPLHWKNGQFGRVPEPMTDVFVFPWRKSEEFFTTADGLVTGDLLAEAFEMLQLARQSEAGQAIAAMTARLASGSDDLAQLLRQRDDLLLKRDVVSRSAGLQARLAALDAELDRIETRLDAEFPSYSAAGMPRPLGLSEARDLLRGNEAMAVFLARDNGLHTFLVTPDYVGWHRSDTSKEWLEQAVRRLRLAVDPTERARAGIALNKRAKDTGFDLETASAIWQRSLGPLARYIPKDTTVFLVPDGALQSLPFSMLLTGAPKDVAPDQTRFAAQPWAIRQYGFATLPVPASLRALRQASQATVPRVPFAGVGNPVLGGHSDAAIRGVLENPAALADLVPLPETEHELRELNRLVADGTGRLYLSDKAREPVLKSGALSDARVLAFATHGLMGGELDGINEPALVLTPPATGSVEDDGLLSASEIAGLTLNADWVLLSACNTAMGPGGSEAEGLSGLARAFFYAGARRLLVSHWSVQSDPTVALTTGMFRLAGTEDDDPTGAQALRKSMLQMIDHPKRATWSHPAAWAPFVTVGG